MADVKELTAEEIAELKGVATSLVGGYVDVRAETIQRLLATLAAKDVEITGMKSLLDLAKRMADYIRMETETGTLIETGPCGIARRDFMESYRVTKMAEHCKAVATEKAKKARGK